MKTIKLAPNIEKSLEALLKSYPLIGRIVQSITQNKGSAFLVGGAVRDLLLDRPIQDLDIEVHGIELADLETILTAFGPVSLVGKSFGVLKLHGLDVDWSLPRLDKAGRKPEVTLAPNLSFEQAFARRDLTFNAMGIDLVTHVLVDPFHGLDDLRNKLLRAPDAQLFVEDPLRLFRVMQFVGRFEMRPVPELNKICADMDISGVSTERIEAEFEKLLLHSLHPSRGIEWLDSIGRLQKILPEVFALKGVPQDPAKHPEGDVFEHTMQALDAAAIFSYIDTRERLIVMLAVLCHDLGKPATTCTLGGVWKSLGHAQEGVPLAQQLLKRLTSKQQVIDAVLPLVRHHMAPIQLPGAQATLSAYKRLARNLAPYATMRMLALVALADYRGRSVVHGKPLNEQVPLIEAFLNQAHAAHVEFKPELPVLHGRDVMELVEPGPYMGELLHRAYEIQLSEGIVDKDSLLARVKAEMGQIAVQDNKKS
jgi:tRNA nucleotidyltransferase (CCA-adding enzyme)